MQTGEARLLLIQGIDARPRRLPGCLIGTRSANTFAKPYIYLLPRRERLKDGNVRPVRRF